MPGPLRWWSTRAAGTRPACACSVSSARIPEFRQIGVALFFSSFDGAVPHTWDRHLYGTNGAMISGGRIRPGLYRYICEADLADKQAEGLRPIEFIETMARRHDPWLAERFTSEPRVGEPWAMAPIGYRVLEVARPRLLLCGDAAGYLSPLTGQGLEFAMRMGRLAARTAHDALEIRRLLRRRPRAVRSRTRERARERSGVPAAHAPRPPRP